jgi:two-component system, OmpR family, phosphate regulon sensor histidine kinase PhoR
MDWNWVSIGAIAGGAAFVVLIIVVVRRRWIAPWGKFETLLDQVAQGEQPPTFLIGGGRQPRRTGLALENLNNRHRQLAQQLFERVAEVETILGAMQDGLLVVDTNRHVVLVNRMFRELFGLDRIPMGAPVLDVIRKPELDRLIAETLHAHAARESELTLADGQNKPVRRLQLSAMPLQDDVDVTTGAVVLFHDITQLKQADEIRRDFVANVSHELRTPLSILRGYIETLRDDPHTSRDEMRRILEVMERHSRRLNLIVDDLLALAQLESANSNLQISNIRVDDLFFNVARDWEKKLGEKNLHVVVDLAPDVRVVPADPTRLQEILYNLLDNAVKYSAPGAEIRLHAQRRDGQVALTVTDTGIGIGPEDLPRIFERFYRVDKARSSELGGTGLGLSIVKHIAQLHGGSVEAESEPGKGTTIRVILPGGTGSVPSLDKDDTEVVPPKSVAKAPVTET